ncbi:MAG TPA: hypothetical protein VD757_02180, partial [Candidatus Nitrosocosmicus sp.]|nr:hypothetical protein [Candidatus Nitrosocosmicus sp.]
MKRYGYLALLLFSAVLISIVCFHSWMNLQEIVAAPSEMWGRHMTIGVTEFKKSPTIYTKSKSIIAIFADEKGFNKVEVDGMGNIIAEKSINIEGYYPSRLIKYQAQGNKLFWTENYDLFCTELQEGKLNKKKLLSEVLDFQLVEQEAGTVAAVSTKAAVSLYSVSEQGTAIPIAEAQVNDAAYISAAVDSRGSIYIAGASRTSPTDYELRLFMYDPAVPGLVERTEPVMIENYSTSREGSNSMNNLELGFDRDNVYVFYEIGKSSSQGLVARTYIGRIPRASGKLEKLVFERFKLEEGSKDTETYISSLKCLDNSGDDLSMIMTTPVRTSVKREGSELVYAAMEDGKLAYKSIATNTGQWNSFTGITRLEDQYVASFLQTIGGTSYIVNLTSTGEEYKANHNKTTMADIKASAMGTIGAYVFSIFTIFINLLIVAFILLWPISVDFFEWKYFFKNPLITFRIGAFAETFMMYFSIARIYRNAESVTFMPEILKHGLTPLGVLLVTAGLSYYILRLYRKSKSDLHSFTELALFILIHNIFVYFLYTAYIARF